MTVDNLTALNARDDLLWIADHWPELRARLRPGGGNALTGVHVSGGDDPAPIDLHVSDLMHEITQNVARYYGQILLEESDSRHGCEQPKPEHGVMDCPQRVDAITTSEMPGLLRDVARAYGHFTTDEQLALGFCDDAAQYRWKVHRTIQRPAPPTYVGPCRTDNCAGELYVKEGHTAGSCRECGEGFDLMQQREWLEEQMSQRLMTPSEIVSALMVLGHKVPIGTVKSWISRGRLVEHGDGLYSLAEAKALAENRGRSVA